MPREGGHRKIPAFTGMTLLLGLVMAKFSHPINRPKNRLFKALGLMSGTSMDGIDVACVETDGRGKVRAGAFASYPYRPAFRAALKKALGRKKVPQLEKELTRLHAKAIQAFCKKHIIKPGTIDCLGFHGHTLFHAPHKKITVQIGDGTLLAKLTGIPAVYDFRTDDVKAGGQGAPLVPVYHQALAAKWKKPVVFLNIGGVANITYVGEKELIACDTGPGNALIDDWVLARTGKPFDRNGALAARGEADIGWLKKFLAHPYFKKKAPKSLDREAFAAFVPHHLGTADGAATLTLMTVLSIAHALKSLPKAPREIIVCGGGRRNAYMMKLLGAFCGAKVVPIEARKLNGDATEAEAFAYMAVRAAMGLPISFKTTTGRKKP